MLEERKAAVLNAVVLEYIETAQPVGSSSVSRSPDISASSATIRNDMAALEDDGFLLQPHTSAGRIPTEKGYRYFVDSVGEISLDRPDTQQVSTFFHGLRGEIEETMRQTAGLLTSLTDHTALIVNHTADQTAVRSITPVALSPRLVLAVVVLANGVIDKHTVAVDTDLDGPGLDRIHAVLAAALRGRRLGDEASLGSTGDPDLDRAARRIAESIQADDSSRERVYVDGRSRVVDSFEAMEPVRRVLTILEQQLLVVSLLANVVNSGLTVAIGSETGVEPLAGCSLVVSPYSVDGETAGSIAVLGPTRMNYPRTMAAVAVVGQQLGHRLSEG